MKKESRGAGDVEKKEYDADSRTITVTPGQAFPGDNRSSSALGLGDGLFSHTSKWLQVCQSSSSPTLFYLKMRQCNAAGATGRACAFRAFKSGDSCLICAGSDACCALQVDGHYSGNLKSPMEYIHDAPPIKVHGSIVASFGCE